MATAAKRILIADDDLDDQEILIEVLNQMDPSLEIVTAVNGGLVLDYLAERGAAEFPDLVVLDYKMPIMSGVEVLEHLREDERYAAIPMVVWSTSGQPEHRMRCLEAGARQYFIKPSSLQELRTIAGQLLALALAGK